MEKNNQEEEEVSRKDGQPGIGHFAARVSRTKLIPKSIGDGAEQSHGAGPVDDALEPRFGDLRCAHRGAGQGPGDRSDRTVSPPQSTAASTVARKSP